MCFELFASNTCILVCGQTTPITWYMNTLDNDHDDHRIFTIDVSGCLFKFGNDRLPSKVLA